MISTDSERSAAVDSPLIIPFCEISPAAQDFLRHLAERNGTSISQEAARILESSLAEGHGLGL